MDCKIHLPMWKIRCREDQMAVLYIFSLKSYIGKEPTTRLRRVSIPFRGALLVKR